jgi:hypothetical protein
VEFTAPGLGHRRIGIANRSSVTAVRDWIPGSWRSAADGMGNGHGLCYLVCGSGITSLITSDNDNTQWSRNIYIVPSSSLLALHSCVYGELPRSI